MYVPSKYDGSRAFPLIIALHGLGGTEDSFFDGYEKAFPPLAERHGYIVAAPLGYRVDGSYGWGLGTPPADPTTRRVQERSEADVMEVLRLVRQQYTIDENRIYLAGHSMGAIGTWRIAPKYPDLFAAIATFSGAGQPATLEHVKHVPEFVVHGDNDPTVNVQGSASDGGEGQGTRDRGDLHRSARRHALERRRAQFRRCLRVLRRACEARPGLMWRRVFRPDGLSGSEDPPPRTSDPPPHS